jgi:hypothetical protein
MEQSIPKHIARRTYYSIPFIFLASIVAYRYNYQRLSALLFFLTYTSIAFWNSPKKGYYPEKILDMSTAVLTITTMITIESYFLLDIYRYLFWGITAVSITGYIINDFWFEFNIKQLDEFSQKQISKKKNVSFIDEPQNMTTIDIRKIENAREKVQTNRVYIHMVFLHVLPSVACIYCIIKSPVHP